MSQTDGGWTGSNLFGQTFSLRVVITDSNPQPPAGMSMSLVWGYASSPITAEEIPVVGLVSHSDLYQQTRFLPLVYFTDVQHAGAFFTSLASILNPPLIDEAHLCDLPADAKLYRRIQGMNATQCINDNHRSTWFTLGVCMVFGTPACLFPPTSLVGCPGLIVCNTANAACMVYRDVTTTAHLNNTTACLCLVAQNGGTNWSDCKFECPSCTPVNPR